MKGNLSRFTFYFLFSGCVTGLFALTFFGASYAASIGLMTAGSWYHYTTGLLSYLLLPSVYGLLFSLPARSIARRGLGQGRTVFVMGAVVGLVTTVIMRSIFIEFNRIACSADSCQAPDLTVDLMFAASLIPAVVLPLSLAYYKWPRQ